jgi:hypothetical protein
MIRAFTLAVFLSATPVLADDAGVADAGMVSDAGAVVPDVPGSVVIETGPTVINPNLPNNDLTVSYLTETAKAIHEAVKNKEWGRMLFLIITLIVLIMRKVVIPRVKALQAKIVPLILTFFWSGFGMLATTWGAGEKLTAGDVWMALQAGIMAAGGWSILKSLLEHFVPKEEGKKNWATVLLDLIGATKPKEDPAPAPTPAPGA